jgi:hypothetical protein
MFLFQNREPRRTVTGSDCNLEARYTVPSRDMQTAELDYCIPDCPPSALSSAHHVVCIYNPAQHTEDLCVYWWIILKRTLQKIRRQDAEHGWIDYEGDDPSFDSRQGLRNVQTAFGASYFLCTRGNFSGSRATGIQGKLNMKAVGPHDRWDKT